MNGRWRVETTPHFDRELRKLTSKHPELAGYFYRVVRILGSDPSNRLRIHPIRKLEAVAAGEGQYRMRLGRFRFRYDIEGHIVYLKAVALRSEGTYR